MKSCSRGTFCLSKTPSMKIIRFYSTQKATHKNATEYTNISDLRYQRVAPEFWKSQANQRMYFDLLGKELGVRHLDDWYEKLSQNTMRKHSGRNLLIQRRESPVTALMAAYPEHNWIPWKFNCSPGFWKSKENQRKYFDWLGQQIGVKELDDWYDKLSIKLLRNYGGRSLMVYYKESPAAALIASYPEHNWIPWKFTFVTQGFWKSKENQKKFFDELGKQLGVQTLDDWYDKLDVNAVANFGGHRLLKKYIGSPIDALTAVYPEHNWVPWKFKHVSRGFWSSQQNIGAYLAYLSEKLSIQTLDDWYRVDKKQLHDFGAAAVLAKYKGLYNLLKEQYPHHPWDIKKFKQVGKKTQRWLAVTLKKLFPGEEIIEDFLHPEVKMPHSNRSMQLDVFIPSRSLAFEYQGIQHYQEVGVFNPTRTYQERDEEKRALCAANNIKLIEVPYWWNRTREQLEEMINKA